MLRNLGSKIFYYIQKLFKIIKVDSALFSADNSLDHIIHNIYVGDLRAADNKELLRQNGITHIINCADNAPLVFPNDFIYLHLKLKDNSYQSIIEAIELAVNFILSNSNRSQNILIHCIKGASRSGSILIAYLMIKMNFDYEAAFKLAVSKRKVIKPNKNFEEQLRSLENKNLYIK